MNGEEGTADERRERVATMRPDVMKELLRRYATAGEGCSLEIRDHGEHGLRFRVVGSDGRAVGGEDMNEVFWCPPICGGG